MGGVRMEQVNSPWGFLPRGWRLSTIDEEKERLTDYVANGSFASLASNVHYKDTEDYAVLIRLVDFNNDFKGPFVYIDEHAYSFLSKSSLSGGEIIISNVGANVGTVFKCPNLPYKMSLAPNAITIKLKGDNDFYYYWFKSKIGQANIQALVTGSAQPKFNKTNFRSMYIPVPPLDVQRRIASILSSLDRKIELNNRINADLEKMAQAIFKNWFVDFEPFKDGKFVDSELGMIPEGWKVGTLKDLLYLRKDSIKAANKGNLPYLPIDTIPMHCLVATDFKSNDEAKSSLQTFEQNDIVVGAMRVYFHRVILAPCKGITRTTCFVLSVKNENALAYSLMQCNQDEAISFAEKTSKGSTMPYAVWDGGYGEYKVVIPPSEVMKSFNDLLSNFFSKMNKNTIENSRLSTLRDTLLPRLMSGELEVPE